jgi:hypothetical protein|tara:strand:- start:5565 stop:5717 length:153 start_codon:yes stop_codon:yes gene_type:complete
MKDDIAEVIITQIVLKLEKFSKLIEKDMIDELKLEIDLLKDEVTKYGRDN